MCVARAPASAFTTCSERMPQEDTGAPQTHDDGKDSYECGSYRPKIVGAVCDADPGLSYFVQK
jgi:hypothetical protein